MTTGAERARGEWLAVRAALAVVAAAVAVAIGTSAIVNAFHVPLTRLEKMRTCFESEKGLTTGDVGNDVIAASAVDGSTAVVIQGSGVHIALARTAEEAAALRAAYVRIDPTLTERLDVRGTVVYLWDGRPTSVQRQTVYDCWY